jgi:hypothetical protein
MLPLADLRPSPDRTIKSFPSRYKPSCNVLCLAHNHPSFIVIPHHIGHCPLAFLNASGVLYLSPGLVGGKQRQRCQITLGNPNHKVPYAEGVVETTSSLASYLANSPLVSHITFKENSTVRMTTTKRYDFLKRLQSIRFDSISRRSTSNLLLLCLQLRRPEDTHHARRWLILDLQLRPARAQVISGKRYWADGTSRGAAV